MFPARIAIAKAIEDAQPAAGGTCETFNATLKLFTPAALGSSQVTLNEITAQSFEITHVGTNTISQGQEVIVGQTIDERWITLPSSTGQATTAHPRIQFVTLAKISNREVYVKVLRTHHNAPNLATGVPLQYGDTLHVCDPFNLWSDIEAGATGWAYLAYVSTDDPETTGVTEPSHVTRYEIEECSLPINLLEGEIVDCMYPGTQEAEVNIVIDQGIRSGYPNVDECPEIRTSEGGQPFIAAQNPYHLDAVPGSKVKIRRVTNLMSSDPDPNYTCPKSRSSTTTHWEIESVEKWWARIIRVKRDRSDPLTPERWEYANDHGDGEFASESDACNVLIESDANTNEDVCRDENAEEEFGWAIWKSKIDDGQAKYQVLSSKSALLGDPEKINIVQAVAFDGCDLNMIRSTAKVFCKGEPQISSTSINAVPKTVVTAGELHITGEDCGQCKWRAEKLTRTLNYKWDGDSWELLNDEACPAGGTLTPDPTTQPEPANDGDILEVTCETYEWVQYEFCYTNGSSLCDCPTGPTTTPDENSSDYIGDCTGSHDESVQLCWTYSTETIYTLPCGSPVTDGDSSCVPLVDCPPDDDSSGGDTP